MEITAEQKEELKTVVENNPQGLTFNELYSKAKSFSDETELSCGIHELSRESICVKINGKYFPKNNIQVVPSSASDAVTEEIKGLLASNGLIQTTATQTTEVAPVVEHKVVQAQVKRTSVEPVDPPKTKVPPCGNLRRSSTKGVIAYALYKVRGDVLTRKDLNLLFTKETSSGAVYQALLSLLADEMIEKANTEFSNMSYRWNDKFGYPFPTNHPDDKKIVPFKNYLEFEQFKDRIMTPSKPTAEINVLVKNISPEQDGIQTMSSSIIVDGITGNTETHLFPDDDSQKLAERTVPYKPVSDALATIRANIAHHEAQLATLRNLERQLEFVTL